MLAKEPTWFSMDGQTIEVVREFGYLGQAGTNTEDRCFSKHHVASVTAKFNTLCSTAGWPRPLDERSQKRALDRD